MISELYKHYGRKQGFIRHVFHLFLGCIGCYRKFWRVDWTRVERLIFVCKGNICRSPYAEAKARATGLTAISFGLEVGNGTSADTNAIKIATQHGIDLTLHRPRSIASIAIKEYDLLLAMEPWHARKLLELYGETQVQVSLVGLWSHPRRPHIEDPYGLSEQYFSECFAVIDDAIREISIRLEDVRR
jgi:protein-tyrosine phosphatase